MTIRQRARDVVTPLSRDGIEILKFHRETQGEVTLQVTSNQVPSFEVTEEAEPLLDQQIQLNVEIASVAFSEGNKW